MDTIKFFKEAKRMCASHRKCSDCCFNSEDVSCKHFVKEHPEKAIELLERWLNGNPPKTILEDIKEKYPNIPMDKNNTPTFCPCSLDNRYKQTCEIYYDKSDCYKCWSQELIAGE